MKTTTSLTGCWNSILGSVQCSRSGFRKKAFLRGRQKNGYEMGKIAIANPQDAVEIDRRRLREVARAVLEGEGITEGDISLAFVDNATIHQLNKRYLNHDEPTDVLSFPLSEAGAKK